MSITMNMPKIGVNMTEAQIVKWLVKPGDTISEGDAVLDAETDKATQTIFSDKAGKIMELLAREGEVVACHEPLIAFFEVNGGQSADAQAPEPAVSRERVRISPLAKKVAAGLSIDYRDIAGEVKGRRIVKADVLTFAEKLKNKPAANKAIPGMAMGTASGTFPGIAMGTSSGAISGIATGAASLAVPGKAAEAAPKAVPDMTAQAAAKTVSDAAPKTAPAAKTASVIPMSSIRRLTAQRLSDSHITKPDVPLVTEIDMTEAIAWRENLKARGSDVSFNDIAVKVAAKVSREFPLLIAKFTDSAVVEAQGVNIGVATDTPNGLLVPVVKDADRKGLIEISAETREMIGRARNGNASAEDLSGGTLTVTNLGSFGVLWFAPIINPDESNILALGQIVKRPVVVHDEIVIRPMMYATLVFDHRVWDGAPAAKCLQRFKYLMENPMELLN